jgi:hypothetical protein
MATSVVQHKVASYEGWRKVYDSAEVVGFRKDGKVIAESVHRAGDDPNNLLILHTFPSLADAEAFFGNPALRDIMGKAGVQGAPRIELYEDAGS